jgi:topoisomerase-4 subunit A
VASKQPGLKEQDGMLFDQEVSTKDTLLMFTTLGNYLYIPVFEIEETKWKDLGSFINNIIPIEKNEFIIKILCISNFDEDQTLLLITETGQIKQTKLADFNVSRYTKPIRAMKVDDNDELTSVELGPKQNIIVFTKQANALRFSATDVPIYGTQASGIKSLTLIGDDKVVKAIYAKSSDDLVILTSLGNIKREKVSNIPLTKRLKNPIQLFAMKKRNPHHIRDVSRLSNEQIKENVSVLITAKQGSVSLKVEDIKSSAEYGKPFVDFNTFGKSLFITVEAPDHESSDEDIVEQGVAVQKAKPAKIDKPKPEPKPIAQTVIKETPIQVEVKPVVEKENGPTKTVNPSIQTETPTKPVEKESKSKKIQIKKLSLFDEEDDWKE